MRCGVVVQMTEVERQRREKHYASGKWMKNHPHHHAEWEARHHAEWEARHQAEEEGDDDGSDQDDDVL